MTQTARKGKLYQLQYQIDLSSFIVAHVPVYDCPTSFDSTKLIYFTDASQTGATVAELANGPGCAFNEQPPSNCGRGRSRLFLAGRRNNQSEHRRHFASCGGCPHRPAIGSAVTLIFNQTTQPGRGTRKPIGHITQCVYKNKIAVHSTRRFYSITP